MFRKLFNFLFGSPGKTESVQEYRKVVEIYGEPQDKSYKRKFKTKIVGVTKDNPGGTNRQEVIKTLKVGQELRLVWDQENPYNSWI